MTTIEGMLGIDPSDSKDQLAHRLVSAEESLGKTLRQRRADLGLSVEQVAERMGRDPETVRDIETGNALHILNLHAMATGVAIDHTVTPVIHGLGED